MLHITNLRVSEACFSGNESLGHYTLTNTKEAAVQDIMQCSNKVCRSEKYNIAGKSISQYDPGKNLYMEVCMESMFNLVFKGCLKGTHTAKQVWKSVSPLPLGGMRIGKYGQINIASNCFKYWHYKFGGTIWSNYLVHAIVASQCNHKLYFIKQGTREEYPWADRMQCHNIQNCMYSKGLNSWLHSEHSVHSRILGNSLSHYLHPKITL